MDNNWLWLELWLKKNFVRFFLIFFFQIKISVFNSLHVYVNHKLNCRFYIVSVYCVSSVSFSRISTFLRNVFTISLKYARFLWHCNLHTMLWPLRFNDTTIVWMRIHLCNGLSQKCLLKLNSNNLIKYLNRFIGTLGAGNHFGSTCK